MSETKGVRGATPEHTYLNVAFRAIELLEQEADILDAWAKQSRDGGWSTHQVEPQRRQADALRRYASELRGACR